LHRFDEAEGVFSPKVIEDAPSYYYVPTEGVWKKAGVKKGSALQHRNFYFDDFASRFKLKVTGHDKDYIYDKANKIYRHVTALGKSRSGYQPSDFDWHRDLKTYTLVRSAANTKITAPSKEEKGPVDPLRAYSTPWQVPVKKGDVGGEKSEIVDAEENNDRDKDKSTEKDKGKGLSLGGGEKKPPVKMFPPVFEKKTPQEYKEKVKQIVYPPIKSRIPEKLTEKIAEGNPNGLGFMLNTVF